MQAHQRSKGWHRPSFTCFELGKRLGILRRRRFVESRLPQRLIGPKRFAAPAQHQVSDRSASKLLCAVSDRGADANTRAQKLVGGLKPRRSVDGVTIRRIVEEAAAAEITDQRRASVNADAGDTEIHSLGLPPFAECLRPGIEI